MRAGFLPIDQDDWSVSDAESSSESLKDSNSLSGDLVGFRHAVQRAGDDCEREQAREPDFLMELENPEMLQA